MTAIDFTCFKVVVVRSLSLLLNLSNVILMGFMCVDIIH